MNRAAHTLALQAANALADLDDLERWVLLAAPLVADPGRSNTWDRPRVTATPHPSGMPEPEPELRLAWRAATRDLATAHYGLSRLGWPTLWAAPPDRGLPCDATLLLDGILLARLALARLAAELRAADRTGGRLPPNRARDARDTCRTIAAAARRCAQVTTPPPVTRDRTCKRKGCTDPATGTPRLMRPDERGRVCNACRKRDHRTRLAGAA